MQLMESIASYKTNLHTVCIARRGLFPIKVLSSYCGLWFHLVLYCFLSLQGLSKLSKLLFPLKTHCRYPTSLEYEFSEIQVKVKTTYPVRILSHFRVPLYLSLELCKE